MKLINKKIAILPILLGMLNSCDVLDVTPPNMMGEEVVFSSEASVTAYISKMYDDLLIEDFQISSGAYDNETARYRFEYYTGYAVACENEDVIDKNGEGIDGNIGYHWFNYEAIRNVNSFFQLLDRYADNFAPSQVEAWKAEAHAIRAWYYFSLAKRFGGVPIVTEPQDVVGLPVEELMVPRSSEKETWDFILNELDQARAFIPVTSQEGRITRDAVFFLKHKAALFAASIARYNTPIEGIGNYVDNNTGKQVCGIPASEANSYYKIAFDAADSIVAAGRHQLARDLDPNPSTSYARLFTSPDKHTEDILVKYYKKPTLGHRWDYFHLPKPYGVGSRFDNPTLELIDMYDNLDGSSAKVEAGVGEFVAQEYASATEMFENRDYRLAGSVYYPGGLMGGEVFDVRKGVIVDGKVVESGNEVEVDGVTYSVRGAFGMGQSDETYTGFLCRKYIDEANYKNVSYTNLSDHPWIAMRYAETLLTMAEAAIENGDESMITKGLEAINEVRGRAGLPAIDRADYTVDEVRKQWVCEFVFENELLWHMRRWRTLSTVLTGDFQCHGLEPFWDIKNNVWKFRKSVACRYPKTSFMNRYYYNRIGDTDISSNPKIIQNYGY